MNHFPRKRLGQHFLCDLNIIQQIVDALNPKPSQHLIEIGPGRGALTFPVLKKTHHLEVIEFDRDLVAKLQASIKSPDVLVIHEGDVLNIDFAKLKNDERLLRVFGNLPYNISTPLVFHLIEYSDIIADMLFMLQKEVAERLAAHPSTKEYGRLSVMVQYHCQVELLFDVLPSAFFPPPQVNSTIVRLIPLCESLYLADDYVLFAKVVRTAFGQRRKTLRNSLKGMVRDEDWEQVYLSSDLRPENLSVKNFVDLSNIISKLSK